VAEELQGWKSPYNEAIKKRFVLLCEDLKAHLEASHLEASQRLHHIITEFPQSEETPKDSLADCEAYMKVYGSSEYKLLKKDSIRVQGYAKLAFKLKTCEGYQLFQRGPNHEGVGAQTRQAMKEILTELVESSREKEDWKGPPGERKFSTLLLLSHFGSIADVGQEPSPFMKEITDICANRMEEITHDLEAVEAEMRSRGTFDQLVLLKAGKKQRLRQDAENVLGKHPGFLECEDLWKKPPVWAFGFTYSAMSQQMYDSLDPDMQEMCVYSLTTLNQQVIPGTEDFPSVTIPHPAKEGKTLTLLGVVNFQPFILWMLTIARKVNLPFQEYAKSALPLWYEGSPSKVPIKGFPRCKEKQEEKYTHTAFDMPSSAVMCDCVRCLIVCPTEDNLREAFQIVCDKFEVVRVKNGFADPNPAYGFRQILINVLFRDESTGLSMICEIQLNLSSYVHVKHMIHKLYTICRCEDNSLCRPDLYSQALKKAIPF
jgi:hypothetical protein